MLSHSLDSFLLPLGFLLPDLVRLVNFSVAWVEGFLESDKFLALELSSSSSGADFSFFSFFLSAS